MGLQSRTRTRRPWHRLGRPPGGWGLGVCVEAVGGVAVVAVVADVRAAVATVVEVGVVGGRGFHRCLGYVVIKLLV